MSDEWNEDLMNLMTEEVQSDYVQQIIEKLDDPDYDNWPILIDDDGLTIPDVKDEIVIVDALKAALKLMRQRIFGDIDNP